VFWLQRTSGERAHQGHLAGLIAGSNPQLVDVRLGDVDSLLGVVQLVLDFPETHRAEAHLLLLVDAKKNIGQESTLELCFSPHVQFSLSFSSVFGLHHLMILCEHQLETEHVENREPEQVENREPEHVGIVIVYNIKTFNSHGTHSVLRLSLVALDFGLQLLDELLHPQQSLPVLLRLPGHKENP